MAKEISVCSYIAGVGMCVPEKVITNEYFASYLDTSDEWISERSGIKERRWTEGNTGVSELAAKAATAALANAGLTSKDIDGIVFGTVTPDYSFPSAACMLQKHLGINKGFAFDVAAACAGFIYSLSVADGLIASGRATNILVVGADVLSSMLDLLDRSTCVLFGDGAGAVVLRAVNPQNSQRLVSADNGDTSGIYAVELCADGTVSDILVAGMGSARRLTPESVANKEFALKMDGKEVFKFAVRALAEVSQTVCARAGVDISEVNYFVSHQANMRILQGMAKQLGIPNEKVPANISKYGNTSAATIPLLLAEMAENKMLKKGDLVLLSAVGGGITWGAVLLRW